MKVGKLKTMKQLKQKELDLLIDNHNKYIEALQNDESAGKKLILDEVDFSNNDLSKLNFVDVYITSSNFKNAILENVNLGGAKFYECTFSNMTFRNVNFGKTVLDFSLLTDSTFDNCSFTKINSNETYFQDLNFNNCTMDDVFSNSKASHIQFENCIFNGIEFWECIISNLTFISSYFHTDMISKLNKGSLDEPIIVDGKEAISIFKSNSSGYLEVRPKNGL